MPRLTNTRINNIKKLIRNGNSRKQISQKTGIPEGTISHYQNPHKQAETKRKKPIYTHLFTKIGIAEHDNVVAEEAYRKAAICTIKKLDVFNHEPIIKALKILERYKKYLIKTYNLEEK